jgi:hypothetical protein
MSIKENSKSLPELMVVLKKTEKTMPPLPPFKEIKTINQLRKG